MTILMNTTTGRLEPEFGEGGLSRTAAHRTVQRLLDRAKRELYPASTYADAAQLWKQGARDDTVRAGKFIYCIYEYDDDGDPGSAAVAWLEDFAARAGLPAIWTGGQGQGADSGREAGAGPDQVDPGSVVRSTVLGLVPGRRYHSPLPPELEPWYCYTVDAGHSLVVVPESLEPEAGASVETLIGSTVPASAKTVLRVGWRMRDGFPVSPVEYDDALGVVTPSDEYEFGDEGAAEGSDDEATEAGGLGAGLDPTAGLFGTLVLSGWIGTDPRDGREVPFAYLSTPGNGATGAPARQTMPAVATTMGLDARPGAVTEKVVDGAHLEITADGWAALVLGDSRQVHPMSAEWRAMALDRGFVVLVVAYLEQRSTEDSWQHYERCLAERRPALSLGLIPALAAEPPTA